MEQAAFHARMWLIRLGRTCRRPAEPATLSDRGRENFLPR
jgi:hypothetical protein